MSVDLIALYLKLHAQCQAAPDGIYKADWQRLYKDTGHTTFNVLSPLMQNGSIEVKGLWDEGSQFHSGRYAITVCEVPVKETT